MTSWVGHALNAALGVAAVFLVWLYYVTVRGPK